MDEESDDEICMTYDQVAGVIACYDNEEGAAEIKSEEVSALLTSIVGDTARFLKALDDENSSQFWLICLIQR